MGIQYYTCFTLFLLLISAPSSAQPESAGHASYTSPDSSFKAFSNQLQRALGANDTSFIFSRVDEEVMNSFGYSSGKVRFKELWKDRYVALGTELKKALILGGAYGEDKKRVYVPYLWVTFPDSLDAYRYGYALYNSIPIYKKPDIGSSITGRLEKGWVNVFSWFEGDTVDRFEEPLWYGVATAPADTGYVQSDYIRSPIDFRFWFEKKKGKWYLAGWTVGD